MKHEIDELRGFRDGYEYTTFMWVEEQQNRPIFREKEFLPSQKEPEKIWHENAPNESDERGDNVLSYDEYSAIYETTVELLDNLELKTKFGQSNATATLANLQRLESQYGPIAVGAAIDEIRPDSGELFDVDLLYKTGELAAYLGRLSQLSAHFSEMLNPKEDSSQTYRETDDANFTNSEDGESYLE